MDLWLTTSLSIAFIIVPDTSSLITTYLYLNNNWENHGLSFRLCE
jgi:hypothetical protein